MHEDKVEVTWKDGKPVLNDAAKKWIVVHVINQYSFDERDITCLIKALITDTWTPAAGNAWTLCKMTWRNRTSIDELRTHQDMLNDYTKYYVQAQ